MVQIRGVILVIMIKQLLYSAWSNISSVIHGIGPLWGGVVVRISQLMIYSCLFWSYEPINTGLNFSQLQLDKMWKKFRPMNLPCSIFFSSLIITILALDTFFFKLLLEFLGLYLSGQGKVVEIKIFESLFHLWDLLQNFPCFSIDAFPEANLYRYW